MDILKINNDSLKVMLTTEDMETYSFNCETISVNKKRSLDTIREILRDAGKICDFPSDGAKFFVQLFASSKGECEIFVQRLNTPVLSAVELDRISEEICIFPVPQSQSLFVYSFGEMCPMIETCKRLQTAKYFGNSAAYKDDGGKVYYLLLEERSPLPEEHGGHLCPRNTAYYINEHCRLICRDAVRALGDLA